MAKSVFQPTRESLIGGAFDSGVIAERQRIIKALEADAGECVQTKPASEHLDDYCNCRLIALIKGEQE